MTTILLGIGSNSKPEYYLPAGAKALLKLDPHCQFSDVYESEALGFQGANFFNLVAKLTTKLTLEQLITQLKEIEFRYGRKPDAKKYTDRTLDIDLLTFGDLCQNAPVRLPREDIYRCAYVLLPLATLFPDDVIPGDTLTFAQAWQAFLPKQKISKINFNLLD